MFCKDEFPVESLFEDCCDEFEKQVQQEVVHSSVCKNENYVVEKELLDTINYEDCMAVDALGLVSNAPVAFDLYEEIVIEEEFTEIFQEASYNMFSPVSEEKDHETMCSSLDVRLCVLL